MTRTYNRRTVLAGLGAVGAVAFGSQAVRGREPPYTHFTYAQSDTEGGRLSVAWYETYNGDFQEATNGSTETNATIVTDPDLDPLYVPQATGPIVTLGNILPGDSGSVIIGLRAEALSDEQPMAVWFRPALSGNAENGFTEPELKDPAEDETATGDQAGDLADALQVDFFNDDGIIGGCDGQFWLTDTRVGPEGSMQTVFDALSEGVLLTDDGCLGVGEGHCFGFNWALPAQTGNLVQTDSVTFDLAFRAVTCESTNPFTEAES